MSKIDKTEIARKFIEAIPYSKALSMRLDAIEDGTAVISMPYDSRLIGDPKTGVLHGGAVSALMDTCGGAAVMSHPEGAVSRRDAALRTLSEAVPFIQYLGIQFDRRGDELTAILPYRDELIGNPVLPAIHGGVTAAFLEVTAIVELTWSTLWQDIEEGRLEIKQGAIPDMPKTIDFTVDYLRAGLPRDAYARARVNRSGRRYASVHVEGWQDNRARLFAQATGHFLMPDRARD